jgi:hypothetical protein
VERREVHTVPRDVDGRAVGVEEADQLVAGGLRGHDDARGATDGRPRGGAVEAGTHGAVQLGLGEERDVVQRDHDRHRCVQRHRVVGRVDEVGIDLLGHQRQPGLLPRQPRRAVRDGGRPGHDLGVAGDAGEPLRVRPLADDHEVLAGRRQRADQPVDVAPDPSPVGRHRGRVEEDARCPVGPGRH